MHICTCRADRCSRSYWKYTVLNTAALGPYTLPSWEHHRAHPLQQGVCRRAGSTFMLRAYQSGECSRACAPFLDLALDGSLLLIQVFGQPGLVHNALCGLSHGWWV